MSNLRDEIERIVASVAKDHSDIQYDDCIDCGLIPKCTHIDDLLALFNKHEREAINKFIAPFLDDTEARGQGRVCKNCGLSELRNEQADE